MRINEARKKAAEDHPLSRFMGSKRAMGDDIVQLADPVNTNKPCNSVRKDDFVAYLSMDLGTDTRRNKCRALSCSALSCHCRKSHGPCGCRCTEKSRNTKLAK